jgi:serine/threonine protein kinase
VLAQGSSFGGYRIEGVIGRGGMGVVYEATQLSLARRVALKVLTGDLAEDPDFRERFRREAFVQAGMDHPNIVPVYEAGDVEGQLFMAMRFVRGVDLKTLTARGDVDPLRALRILGQVADALDAAHEADLVHRDIKPHNILVGARDRAYLADFGLTNAQGLTRLTKTGQFVGTVDYIAPEQIRGDPATATSDIYALTAVLFECLTGSVPFPTDSEVASLYAHLGQPPPSASARRPGLSAALDPVIARGLAKDPAERFPTAMALIQAAGEALGSRPDIGIPSLPHPAVPPTVTAPAPPPAPERPPAAPAGSATRAATEVPVPAPPPSGEATVGRPEAVSVEPTARLPRAGGPPVEEPPAPPPDRPAALPPPPGNRPRPARARMAVLAGLAALLLAGAAVLAVVVTRGGDGKEAEASSTAPADRRTGQATGPATAPSGQAVRSGVVELRPDPRWTLAAEAGDTLGVKFADPMRLTRAEPVGAVTLLAGVVPPEAAGWRFLPTALERQLTSEARPPEVTTVGGAIAYRLSGLRRGGDPRTTLTTFAIPSDAGLVTLVCEVPDAVADGLPACEQVVSTLALTGTRARAARPDDPYVTRVREVMAGVAEDRAGLRAADAGGDAAAVADPAAQLASAARQAHDDLTGDLEPGQGLRPINAVLINALTRLAEASDDLAGAARDGDPEGQRAARARVREQEARLDRAMSDLDAVVAVAAQR